MNHRDLGVTKRKKKDSETRSPAAASGIHFTTGVRYSFRVFEPAALLQPATPSHSTTVRD